MTETDLARVVAAALAEHQWYRGEYENIRKPSVHANHDFDSDCAVCTGDLPRIAEVVVKVLAADPPDIDPANVDPEMVVKQLKDAGWTYAGHRSGEYGYTRLDWPAGSGRIRQSIRVPTGSRCKDAGDYEEMMTHALTELYRDVTAGQLAARVLRGIAREPIGHDPG